MSQQNFYIERDRRIRKEYKELIKDGKIQKTKTQQLLAEEEGLTLSTIRRILYKKNGNQVE